MIITIGTQSNPEDRIHIEINGDFNVFAMRKPEWLTDIRTNIQYLVQRADCGLGSGCMCAVELVAIRMLGSHVCHRGRD